MPKQKLVVTVEIEIDSGEGFEFDDGEIENLFWMYSLPDVDELEVGNTYSHPDYESEVTRYDIDFVEVEA